MKKDMNEAFYNLRSAEREYFSYEMVEEEDSFYQALRNTYQEAFVAFAEAFLGRKIGSYEELELLDQEAYAAVISHQRLMEADIRQAAYEETLEIAHRRADACRGEDGSFDWELYEELCNAEY